MTAAAKKQIVKDALALPKKARVELAEQLWESVESPGPKSSKQEWNKSWKAELGKRIADIDSGKVKLIPHSEVRKRLDKILNKA